MKSVGIDIGGSSVKVAEIEFRNRRYVLTNYVEHPLNLNPGHDVSLEVLEFLRDLVSRYDVQQTKFVMGLPTR